MPDPIEGSGLGRDGLAVEKAIEAEMPFRPSQLAMGEHQFARHDPLLRHDVAFRAAAFAVLVDEHQAQTVPDTLGDALRIDGRDRWGKSRFAGLPQGFPVIGPFAQWLAVNGSRTASCPLRHGLGLGHHRVGRVEGAAGAFHGE